MGQSTEFNGNDGSFSCLGKWIPDPEDSQFIYVTFYPSTINVSAANPVIREVLRTGMLKLCDQSMQSPFRSSISADGQNLALNGGGYYKVSSNTGLTKGLKLKDLPIPEDTNPAASDSIEYETVKATVSENSSEPKTIDRQYMTTIQNDLLILTFAYPLQHSSIVNFTGSYINTKRSKSYELKGSETQDGLLKLTLYKDLEPYYQIEARCQDDVNEEYVGNWTIIGSSETGPITLDAIIEDQ